MEYSSIESHSEETSPEIECIPLLFRDSSQVKINAEALDFLQSVAEPLSIACILQGSASLSKYFFPVDLDLSTEGLYIYTSPLLGSKGPVVVLHLEDEDLQEFAFNLSSVCIYAQGNSVILLKDYLESSDQDPFAKKQEIPCKDLKEVLMSTAKPIVSENIKMTGPILCEMIQLYAQGSSLKDIWNDFFRSQTQKAYQAVMSFYETAIEELSRSIPMPTHKLKSQILQVKKRSLKRIDSFSLGNERLTLEDYIHVQISDKYKSLKIQNRTEMAKILNEQYEDIRKHISNYQNFTEYSKNLSEFQAKYTNFDVFTESLLHSLVSEALSAGAEHFLDKKDRKAKISEEKLESFLKEKEHIEKGIVLEKEDFVYKEQRLVKQIEDLKTEKENVETHTRKQIKEYKQNIEEVLAKNWKYEEKIKELQREVNQAQGEKTQEIALLKHKINHLETNLHETSTLNLKASGEISFQKQEYFKAIKDVSTRYDQQIKNLQNRINEETEKSIQLENALLQQENKAEIEKSQLEEAARILKEQIQEMSGEIEKARAKYSAKEHSFKSEHARIQQDKDSEIVRLRGKIDSLEGKLKDSEGKVIHLQSNELKENAVLAQKNEFLSQELEECRNALAAERRHQELMLQSMSDVDYSKDELDIEISKVKNSYEQKIQALEYETSESKRHFNTEISSLKDLLEEKETKIAEITHDSYSKIEKLEFCLEESLAEKQTLMMKIEELKHCSHESESSAKNKVKELESTLENLRYANSEEIAKHEEMLSQLQECFKVEKNRLEMRIKEEKERGEKRLAIAVEECETRAREDQESLEEEVTGLQEEIQSLLRKHSDELMSLKQKSALDAQKIETLENYLKNNKEQVSDLQINHNKTLDSQLSHFNSERKTLQEKLEKLSSENSHKDREIASFEHKISQLNCVLHNKEKEITDLKEITDQEKKNLMTKLENFKENNFKIADEYSQKQSNYNKDLALANQQIAFLTAKVTELEEYKNIKEDNFVENLDLDQLLQAKDSMEFELEQKRQVLKEQESRFTKELGELKKEKFALIDKVAYLEQKRFETENTLKLEMQDLQEQLDLQKAQEPPSSKQHLEEIERLKEELYELQGQMSTTATCYDRDKILWDNKFNFLMNQRDQARNDLSDAQKKFDLALERLQRKGAADKDKVEAATASIVASVETRYQSQLKDMQDAHNNALSRCKDKIKSLERENKSVREELDIEKRNKDLGNAQIDHKMKELADREKHMNMEIKKLKSEKNKKFKEMADIYSEDRDALRNKLIELENRLKETEHSKSQLHLEHEKEKAKWTLERDSLLSQKNEAQDLLDRLEKRKEFLLRENEKLKSGRKRGTKKELIQNRSYMPSFMMDASIDDSRVSKENGDSFAQEVFRANPPFMRLNNNKYS